MIRIREIDHLVLRIRDRSRMLQFYCEVLGCSIARDEPELGLVQLRAGRSLLDLVMVDSPLGRKGGAAPGQEGHNMDHVCFRIDPFIPSEIEAELGRHGVAIGELARRHGAEGFGPSLYIQDPEGNTVELKGPPESH